MFFLEFGENCSTRERATIRAAILPGAYLDPCGGFLIVVRGRQWTIVFVVVSVAVGLLVGVVVGVDVAVGVVSLATPRDEPFRPSAKRIYTVIEKDYFVFQLCSFQRIHKAQVLIFRFGAQNVRVLLVCFPPGMKHSAPCGESDSLTNQPKKTDKSV